jgi:sugar (pentulose or hexulose) kinase
VFPTVTIDVGTTSVKLCYFDSSGALCASSRADTPMVADPWGSIYDARALRRLVVEFSRTLDPAERATVRRIAIAGVGEAGGLVRPDLTLASPMISWHDGRGAEQLNALTEAQRSRVYRVTGLPVNTNYGLSKVAWAAEYAAEELDGTQWMNVAEYLAATLTGSRWSEFSLASRTMALDVVSGCWSTEVCAMLGVEPEWFPPLRPAADGVPISAVAAAELDVSTQVRVHVAGHDHMVGGVGANLRRGELLNSTGTTEGLLVLRAEPALEADAERAKLANGRAPNGPEFTLFASIPTGGSAFATLQGLLGIDATRLAGQLVEAHQRYLRGELDLDAVPLVLPQFRGSPPPAKQAAARGIIAGLATDTGMAEVIFGCFLGMAMQFREVLELFDVELECIKVIGPAVRNPLWLQLKADLLGTPLTVAGFPEVVSRGAQYIASGIESDWAASEPRDVPPDPTRHALLAEWAERVRPRWEHLKEMPL